MLHRHPLLKTGYILLNMVETPGHVDFGMEVSKSLDRVEGAILLFDSAHGVQAQTLSMYDKARRIGRMRDTIADIDGGVGGETPMTAMATSTMGETSTRKVKGGEDEGDEERRCLG